MGCQVVRELNELLFVKDTFVEDALKRIDQGPGVFIAEKVARVPNAPSITNISNNHILDRIPRMLYCVNYTKK